jgi:L-alanine-DL-glutamate epimerase-like enolase superfamily enzyme
VIGVAATFDSDQPADSLLGILIQLGLGPDRVGVTRREGGNVGIIVHTDEADYEEMAELMKEHGARTVKVDMTGRDSISSGRPSLTDSPPPPPGRLSG